MDAPQPPKTRLIVGGAAVALAAGVLIATLLTRGKSDEVQAPPASQAGLIIDATQQNDAALDRTRTLRCFVNGQLVGDLPLVDCARRNGVATDALDVGLDQTGALAATGQAGAMITPLPPPAQAPPAAAVPADGPAGACWRYAEGKWAQLPAEMSLSACVQTLFAGRCEKPGGATYGRWAQQTLRLTPGKVETSSDNHSFRTLVEQTAGCVVPPVG